jgi:parallel beta-helix repeat protein
MPLSSLSEVIAADLISTQQYSPLPYSQDSQLQPKNPSGIISGGDTLMLKAGLHGEVFLRNYHNELPITVIAEEGAIAILERVHLQSCKNWIFQGVHVSSEPYGYYLNNRLFYVESHGFHGPTSNITIRQCDIYSTTAPWTVAQDWLDKASDGLFMSADSCLAVGNRISNVDMGLFCIGDYHQAIGNEIINFSGDGGRILGSHNAFNHNVIKENYNVDDNHDDGIQSFTNNEHVVDSNEVIGNLIIDTEDITRPLQGPMHGIGAFDGFYNDWLVANNVISVNHWNGIAFLGANRCTIIHNTVIDPTPNVTPGGSWIKIDDHKDGTPSSDCIVANNVSNQFVVDGLEVGNIVLDSQDSYVENFIDFENFDFRLLPNSSLINNAGPDYSIPTDYYGNDRMGTPDVGAIEYELISSINTEYDQLVPTSIFPNPFSNEVSINDIEPSTLINVYNVSGTLKLAGTLDVINEAVAEFSAGIYYFTFRSNGEIKIGKAIKI